jgi:hypothetical protein
MKPLLLGLIGVAGLGASSGVWLEAQHIPAQFAGPAMGVSMDRFSSGVGPDAPGLMAMSYRFSQLQPGRVGLELGVALFPQALPVGTLALAPDLGAAYNVPIPGGSVLLKGGGSAVMLMGMPGAAILPGFHVGGALLLKVNGRSAVRVDVLRHYYRADGGELEPLWSVGLGFAILPRRQS